MVWQRFQALILRHGRAVKWLYSCNVNGMAIQCMYLQYSHAPIPTQSCNYSYPNEYDNANYNGGANGSYVSHDRW